MLCHLYGAINATCGFVSIKIEIAMPSIMESDVNVKTFEYLKKVIYF